MFIHDIINDTLKRQSGNTLKWSRTSLTMFVALVVSIGLTIADFIVKGFNFEVFLVWICLATGSKLVDALSRKLDPTINSSSQNP